MGKHTVAEAREKLPELIERARSGEDVLITRDGDVVAELRALPGASETPLEWLRANRPKRLAHTIDAVALVRAMRDEGEH
jgi:antitoxin (DNA-binding transcriptional repressor) of toxin-antitoxin stability system